MQPCLIYNSLLSTYDGPTQGLQQQYQQLQQYRGYNLSAVQYMSTDYVNE